MSADPFGLGPASLLEKNKTYFNPLFIRNIKSYRKVSILHILIVHCQFPLDVNELVLTCMLPKFLLKAEALEALPSTTALVVRVKAFVAVLAEFVLRGEASTAASSALSLGLDWTGADNFTGLAA